MNSITRRSVWRGGCTLHFEYTWIDPFNPQLTRLSVFDFELPRSSMCTKPFSFSAFFQDMPWLNVPEDRKAVFIEPLYPRGGLLGGSPDSAPKMSKLQALAAARKKKAQEQGSSSKANAERSTVSLSRDDAESAGTPSPSATATSSQKITTRSFPIRKAQNEASQNDYTPQESFSTASQKEEQEPVAAESDPVLETRPSAFASTMFGNEEKSSQNFQPESLFKLPYNVNGDISITNAFTGPSPDDIVIAAQSKGSTHSAKRI